MIQIIITHTHTHTHILGRGTFEALPGVPQALEAACCHKQSGKSLVVVVVVLDLQGIRGTCLTKLTVSTTQNNVSRCDHQCNTGYTVFALTYMSTSLTSASSGVFYSDICLCLYQIQIPEFWRGRSCSSPHTLP